MTSKEINYKSDKNQVLCQIPYKKFDSRIKLGFRNDPISKPKKPKYKLMGETSYFNKLQMFRNNY